MPQVVCPSEFLHLPGPILDVRSPAEYAQGHIPGARSFPLFSNEERAEVGICYKQEGREEAIELGFKIVGPKLHALIVRAKALTPECQARVHCWRGGMRSSSMAWLLETAGLHVTVLEGGYKGFRRWGRAILTQPRPIRILGGMTGTGKTAVLQALMDQGEQGLDLEQLANHRGSSYGNLGLPEQPSTEHFENLIMVQWAKLSDRQPVWIEAESCQVGRCRVPNELFDQMERAPVLEVVRSRPERLALLQEIYGSADPAQLIAATERIRKRLGGQRTQAAVAAIREDHLARAIDIVLDYYDKTYQHDLERRDVSIQTVDISGLSPQESAVLLRQRFTAQPEHAWDPGSLEAVV